MLVWCPVSYFSMPAFPSPYAHVGCFFKIGHYFVILYVPPYPFWLRFAHHVIQIYIYHFPVLPTFYLEPLMIIIIHCNLHFRASINTYCTYSSVISDIVSIKWFFFLFYQNNYVRQLLKYNSSSIYLILVRFFFPFSLLLCIWFYNRLL